MNFIFEGTPNFYAEYLEARGDLPFGSPGGPTRAEAMRKPGNAVKSHEMKHGMPRYFARIVSYSEDEVVLVGDDPLVGPRFVWRGNQTQYYQTWECD